MPCGKCGSYRDDCDCVRLDEAREELQAMLGRIVYTTVSLDMIRDASIARYNYFMRQERNTDQ